MATPINATILYIMHNGIKIANQLNAELKVSMQIRESLNKDNNGYKSKFPGQRDWELSGEAELAYDAAYGFNQLFEAWENGDPVQVMFTTQVTGTARWKGNAVVTEISQTAGVDESARFSFTLQGSGAVAQENVPAS